VSTQCYFCCHNFKTQKIIIDIVNNAHFLNACDFMRIGFHSRSGASVTTEHIQWVADEPHHNVLGVPGVLPKNLHMCAKDNKISNATEKPLSSTFHNRVIGFSLFAAAVE
jgi:hypothetical protein